MSTEIQSFDYDQLGDNAMPVKGLADRIRIKLKRAAEDVIECGICLRQARTMLKEEGRFVEWLSIEFDLSASTAYRWIRVSEKFEGKTLTGSIAISALYLLSDDNVSESVVDAAVQLANEGTTVTQAVTEDLIESHEERSFSDAIKGDDATDDEEPEIAEDLEGDVISQFDEPSTLADDRPRDTTPQWWRDAVSRLDNLLSLVGEYAPECKRRDALMNHLEAADTALAELKADL